MRVPSFTSDADVIRWLATAPPAAVMALCVGARRRHTELVAQHYDVARLSVEDLLDLAIDAACRALLFRNPHLTAAQIAAVGDHLLGRPAEAEGVRVLEELLAALGAVGRTGDRVALLARLRDWVAARADDATGGRGASPRRRGASPRLAARAYLSAGWFEVTPEDARDIYELAGDHLPVLELLACHPATPIDLLERLQEAGAESRMVALALAANPNLRHLPALRRRLVAFGNPRISATLAPQLTADELQEAIRVLGDKRRLGVVQDFFAVLAPEDHARLTPAALLPLLTSPEADLRLEGQLRLADLPVPPSVPQPVPQPGPQAEAATEPRRRR